MAMFGKHNAPALAAEEEQRGDNQVAWVVSHPEGPDTPVRQQCIRDTYAMAALHSPQPEGRP
jgi:hypothetical protein